MDANKNCKHFLRKIPVTQGSNKRYLSASTMLSKWPILDRLPAMTAIAVCLGKTSQQQDAHLAPLDLRNDSHPVDASHSASIYLRSAEQLNIDIRFAVTAQIFSY